MTITSDLRGLHVTGPALHLAPLRQALSELENAAPKAYGEMSDNQKKQARTQISRATHEIAAAKAEFTAELNKFDVEKNAILRGLEHRKAHFPPTSAEQEWSQTKAAFDKVAGINTRFEAYAALQIPALVRQLNQLKSLPDHSTKAEAIVDAKQMVSRLFAQYAVFATALGRDPMRFGNLFRIAHDESVWTHKSARKEKNKVQASVEELDRGKRRDWAEVQILHAVLHENSQPRLAAFQLPQNIRRDSAANVMFTLSQGRNLFGEAQSGGYVKVDDPGRFVEDTVKQEYEPVDLSLPWHQRFQDEFTEAENFLAFQWAALHEHCDSAPDDASVGHDEAYESALQALIHNVRRAQDGFDDLVQSLDERLFAGSTAPDADEQSVGELVATLAPIKAETAAWALMARMSIDAASQLSGKPQPCTSEVAIPKEEPAAPLAAPAAGSSSQGSKTRRKKGKSSKSLDTSGSQAGSSEPPASGSQETSGTESLQRVLVGAAIFAEPESIDAPATPSSPDAMRSPFGPGRYDTLSSLASTESRSDDAGSYFQLIEPKADLLALLKQDLEQLHGSSEVTFPGLSRLVEKDAQEAERHLAAVANAFTDYRDAIGSLRGGKVLEPAVEHLEFTVQALDRFQTLLDTAAEERSFPRLQERLDTLTARCNQYSLQLPVYMQDSRSKAVHPNRVREWFDDGKMDIWQPAYLRTPDRSGNRIGAMRLCCKTLPVEGAPDIKFPEMTLHFHLRTGVDKPLAQLTAGDLNKFACHLKPSPYSKTHLPVSPEFAIWSLQQALRAGSSTSRATTGSGSSRMPNRPRTSA